MRIANGQIDETYIHGWRAARVLCPPGLIPAPGQYLLAQAAPAADSPLPVPVYPAGSTPGGFYAASPLTARWAPGQALSLKGPLGQGFRLPPTARKVLLACWGNPPGRVLALLEACHTQKAEIVLLAEAAPQDIPLSVEILPPAALPEAARWADYAALDLPIEQIELVLNTPPLREALPTLIGYAQIFIQTPIPCGGLAECGVCAVQTRSGLQLACKDGPVFDLAEVISPRAR